MAPSPCLEEFYLRLGFRRTGQEFQGEVAGELVLD